VCWLALPSGLLLLPVAWPVWCALGGAAQGGGFTVLVATVLARAHGVTDSRRISAAMQGGGYALGAAGPTVVGAVHETTLGWTVPLILVTGALALLAASGLAATGGARTGSPR
jgi:CP family cyanate transporter-like MFS transporter